MSNGKKAIILFVEDFVSYMMNNKLLWKNTLYSYEPVAPVAEEYRESVHNGFNDTLRQAIDVIFDAVRDKVDHLFNKIIQKNDICYNTLQYYVERTWMKYFPDEVDLEGFISYSVFMIGIAARFYRVGATASLDYMASFLCELFPFEDSPEMWNRLDRAARNITRKRMEMKNLRKNSVLDVGLASENKCNCKDIKIEGATFKEVYEKRDSVLENHFNVCSKLSNESSKDSDSKSESSEGQNPAEKPVLMNNKGSLFKSSVLTPVEILDNISASRLDFTEPETPSDFDRMTWQKYGVRPKQKQSCPSTSNKEDKLVRRLVAKAFLKHAFRESGPTEHSEFQHMPTTSPEGSNLNKSTEKTAGPMTESTRLASEGKMNGQTISQTPRLEESGEVADSNSFNMDNIASDKTMELLTRSFADQHITDSARDQSLEFPVLNHSPTVRQENAASDELNNCSSSMNDEQVLQVRESLVRFQVKSFFESYSKQFKNSVGLSEDSGNKQAVKPSNNIPNEDNSTFPHSSGFHHSPSVAELEKTLNNFSDKEVNIWADPRSEKYRQGIGNMKDFVTLQWLNRPKPEMTSLNGFGSFSTSERPLTTELSEDIKVTDEKDSPLKNTSLFSEAAELRHFENISIHQNSPDLPEQENLQKENLPADSAELPELVSSDDSSEYESASEYFYED